jgi:hypothetical protein
MEKHICIFLHKIPKCCVLRRIGKQGLNPQVAILVINGTKSQEYWKTLVDRRFLHWEHQSIFLYTTWIKHPYKAFCQGVSSFEYEEQSSRSNWVLNICWLWISNVRIVYPSDSTGSVRSLIDSIIDTNLSSCQARCQMLDTDVSWQINSQFTNTATIKHNHSKQQCKSIYEASQSWQSQERMPTIPRFELTKRGIECRSESRQRTW